MEAEQEKERVLFKREGPPPAADFTVGRPRVGRLGTETSGADGPGETNLALKPTGRLARP